MKMYGLFKVNPKTGNVKLIKESTNYNEISKLQDHYNETNTNSKVSYEINSKEI